MAEAIGVVPPDLPGQLIEAVTVLWMLGHEPETTPLHQPVLGWRSMGA